MAPVLTKGLKRFWAELNTVFPEREKFTDGWLGDQSHSSSTSGHNPDITGRAEYRDGDSLNEVRATDTDKDLVPGSRIDWMERVVQFLVKKARAGGYIPFRYLIYKRRIWRRANGWRTEVYTGANKHDGHLHASGDYTQKADNWNGTLGLASLREDTGAGGGAIEEDDGMATITPEEFDARLLHALENPAVERVFKRLAVGYIGNPLPEGQSVAGVLNLILGTSKSTLEVVRALASEDDVDEAVLAAALAPAVAALVVPALVTAVADNGGVPLTQEQVTEAVKAAMREGTE